MYDQIAQARRYSIPGQIQDDVLDMYGSDELLQLNSVLNSIFRRKTVPSLSLILGEPVECLLKKTSEVKFSEIELLMAESEKSKIMSAVYVKCSGGIKICTLWYVSQNNLKPLERMILKKDYPYYAETLKISSITEIGNILTASITNAINDDVGCKTTLSVPGYALESLKTLVQFLAADLSDQYESFVVSTAEFWGLNSSVKINMFLIQEPTAIKKLVA